jgi:4-hydroxybenzoate polyprenyltransferase
MIVAALSIGLIYGLARWLPPMLVAVTATFIAVMLARKAQRLTRAMLANRPCDLDYDRKSNRAQRRQMRASLRIALKQTELKSLFPTTVASAELWISPVR